MVFKGSSGFISTELLNVILILSKVAIAGGDHDIGFSVSYVQLKPKSRYKQLDEEQEHRYRRHLRLLSSVLPRYTGA